MNLGNESGVCTSREDCVLTFSSCVNDNDNRSIQGRQSRRSSVLKFLLP